MDPTTPQQRITLDQVVAYNLRRARKLRGWTQTQAAEQLEPYLGELWSSATFSAAERSFEGPRVREFSASQVLALALGFDLPITWFYQPPTPDTQVAARGSEHAVSGEDLVKRLGVRDAEVAALQETAFQLAAALATGAPPYDLIATLIDSELLPIEKSLALAELRRVFARSVPAGGDPELWRSFEDVPREGKE